VVRLSLAISTLLALLTVALAPPLYLAPAAAGLIAIAVTLRYPLVGFGLLAFSIPWASGYAVSISSFPISPTDLLVAAIGVAWLADATIRRRSLVSTVVWTPFMLMFVAVIAVSASQATDIHASLRELVKWLELLVIYLAGARFVTGRPQMRFLVACLVAAGVSQAILGYIQFAFQLGPAAFVHGRFLRAYGTFDQPNPYAGYLNMVLPLALSMAIFARSARERFWYGLACLALAGALLASESRGALLAGSLAVVVVLACASRPGYRLVWLGSLAGALAAWLAALGLVPASAFSRVLDAIGLGGVSFGHVTDANFSAVERAAHWLAGVRMFADHPLLGVGIGNYADAYPVYHPRGWYAALAHAHNYYINVAAEAGVLGLTAYVLLVGSALWYSYAAIRQSSGSVSAVALGVLGALVAPSFHNLFDVLYVHGMVALLGLLMVLVPASLQLGTVQSTSAPDPRPST
jgi:O-antigen ligase